MEIKRTVVTLLLNSSKQECEGGQAAAETEPNLAATLGAHVRRQKQGSLIIFRIIHSLYPLLDCGLNIHLQLLSKGSCQ